MYNEVFLHVKIKEDPEALRMHRVAKKLSKRQKNERKPSQCLVTKFEIPQPIDSVQMLIVKDSK